MEPKTKTVYAEGMDIDGHSFYKEVPICSTCKQPHLISDLKQSSGHSGMICHDCWTAEEQLFDLEDY